jgi:arsenite methyltransferase
MYMPKDIREKVRKEYARAIIQKSSCCGDVVRTGCCCPDPHAEASNDPEKSITGGLYQPDSVAGLPTDMIGTSFGCGNPAALAQLHEGDVVLDLGSGAGLDVFLSARQVGTSGKVYGLDMTQEMLAQAKVNLDKSGLKNVEFLKGYIEDIPLPDCTIDLIISNCVINLSADKDLVLREAYRVLRPGGRFAVSDIVLTRPLPSGIRQDPKAWASCVAGALLKQEYHAKLSAAGFICISIETTREYDLAGPLGKALLPRLSDSELREINGSIVSAFIEAEKPT